MHVENIANGNNFIESREAWNESQVFAADRRYAECINSPRIDEIALYKPPTNYERGGSFCQQVRLATLGPTIVRSTSNAYRMDHWMLVKCAAEIMKSRDSLVNLSIAVNWKNTGEWFIAKVESVDWKCHNVQYLDGSVSKLGLVGFGFQAPPKGSGVEWRLVTRRSALIGPTGLGN